MPLPLPAAAAEIRTAADLVERRDLLGSRVRIDLGRGHVVEGTLDPARSPSGRILGDVVVRLSTGPDASATRFDVTAPADAPARIVPDPVDRANRPLDVGAVVRIGSSPNLGPGPLARVLLVDPERDRVLVDLLDAAGESWGEVEFVRADVVSVES